VTRSLFIFALVLVLAGVCVASPPDGFPYVIKGTFAPAVGSPVPVSLVWSDSTPGYSTSVGGSDLVITYNATGFPAWSTTFAGTAWSMSDTSLGFLGGSSFDPSSSALCVFTDVDNGDAFVSDRIAWLIGCGYALGWGFVGFSFGFVYVVRGIAYQAAAVFR
jgi:hypothetical protein